MFLSAGELCHVLMGRSAASKLRRKSQREASELREQTYYKFFQDTLAMEEEELAREDREEEEEVVFKRQRTVPDTPRASRANTPDPDEREEDHRQVDKVLQLVKSVRDQIKALVLDNTNIRAACDDLRRQCHSQGVAFGDLSRLVNRTREDQEESGTYARNQSGHNPQIRQELLDAEGNLRAQDIGISWQDGETFLHGVRITGQRDAREEDLRRPVTAEAYPSCQRDREDAYRRPAMSTPYQQSREQPPRCIEMSDTPAAHFAVPRQDGRPSHRPAAPIQRFNSKNIGWPAWFRHFKAVADVQGWDKDQRALQMVSYLDEKAMNVAQELSDRELYDYDALVGLLSARFDTASRVSASRSRFHGRTRRHQEDADTYADAITELCRLGYPQSSPELRQELISEQFVRGQSDPELKKYLWVVIRTQKDKKLQTLIEVCTDFASLSSSPSVHRPAEQVFALEEDDDQEEEMFAVVDRQQWNTQRAAEPPLSPELQQIAWATRCDQSHDVSTPLDKHRALAKLRIGIIALHLNHATTPGLSVLAVVSWDTLKFAVQNRTHLFRSGQVDGSTGRTDLDGIVEHPHRETKYRPGPNPHWPVCHRIGPRFIHACHFIYSPGHFIYFHIRWDFILCFTHRTIVSATDQGG